MKAKEIRDLIDFISGSGLEEVNIETEEFKINVKRSSQQVSVSPAPVSAPAPAATPAAAPAPAAEAPKAEPAGDANLITIKSPMIGTFYRSANPDSDPFKNVGDSVSKGEPVCIIEAMKIFNEIESELPGKVVKILIQEATPVEYDQDLIIVAPE